ncbi:serine hydrolase [Lacticaseibacillus sp. GG6-2]
MKWGDDDAWVASRLAEIKGKHTQTSSHVHHRNSRGGGVALTGFAYAHLGDTQKVSLPAEVTKQQLQSPKLEETGGEARADDDIVNPSAAKLRARLHRYLKTVTADGNVSVTFINLAPVPGSAAAKNQLDVLNRPRSVSVAAKGKQMRPAASSVKLAIAAYVSHLTTTGDLTWTPALQAAFDRMMIANQNYFGSIIATRYGKVSMNRYLKKLGMKPVFSYVQADQTTTNDTAALLVRLVDKRPPFTEAKLRERLLTDMGNQEFRSGIPAGVHSLLPHANVQDVIGYQGTTNNDAAIVTTSQGQRFVLAISTQGQMQQDFTQIALIARNVLHIAYFRG